MRRICCRYFLALAFATGLSFTACTPQGGSIGCDGGDELLEATLRLAGDNRAELEAALRRYQSNPADSLKYRAARFLIVNMPGHVYYKGDLLDGYLSYFERLGEQHRSGRKVIPQQLVNEVQAAYGTFSLDALQRCEDIRTVDSAYLCRTVEQAFRVWRGQPWGRNVSFDDFCEYILPYRIGDETLADWREAAYRRYNPLLDSLRASSVLDNADPAVAAAVLIDSLRREPRFFTTTGPGSLPHVGPRIALSARAGSCRELCDYVVYACRAVGIPCAVDFIPLHGDGNGGHQWVAVADKHGALFTSEYPERLRTLGSGEPYKLKKIKTYRATFSVNRRMQRGMARLDTAAAVGLFAPPRMVDVTEAYAPTFKRHVRVPAAALYPGQPRSRVAYLCGSSRMGWEPVAWTEFTPAGLDFADVQAGSVMRVATWEKGRLRFWSDPFELKEPDSLVFHTPARAGQRVVLYAKYSLYNDRQYQQRMVGGVFEGSNDPAFRRRDTLWVIEQRPERLYTEVYTYSRKPYRYVRYVGPARSHCCVSEVEFYEVDGLLPLRGRVLGTPGCYQQDGSHEYPNVFDGRTETSFDYLHADGGWAGLDLGTPKRIGKIVYAPANRDNYVRPLDDYELFYCAGQRWRSLGQQTATYDSLVYDSVPCGALLLLRNYSRGEQERAFVYEDGKQVWK